MAVAITIKFRERSLFLIHNGGGNTYGISEIISIMSLVGYKELFYN